LTNTHRKAAIDRRLAAKLLLTFELFEQGASAVTAPYDESYDRHPAAALVEEAIRAEAEVEANAADRVVTFSDAVVAIAITLLALGLTVPDSPAGTTNGQLLHELRGDWSAYLAFLISFAVIGSHWATHRRVFRYVTRMNVVVGRFNMVWLLMMVLTPFAANLLAGKGAFGVRFAIYALIQVIATGCLMRMKPPDRPGEPAPPERARPGAPPRLPPGHRHLHRVPRGHSCGLRHRVGLRDMGLGSAADVATAAGHDGRAARPRLTRARSSARRTRGSEARGRPPPGLGCLPAPRASLPSQGHIFCGPARGFQVRLTLRMLIVVSHAPVGEKVRDTDGKTHDYHPRG